MKTSLIIFSLLFSSSLYADEALTGEEIFTTFCADACHQAPDRSRLRPAQWRVVLNTMQTRMESSGRSPLTEGQTKRLFYYLSAEN